LFVAFSTYHQDAQGQFCLFSMAVAAEVAVGLAILVSIFRNLGSIDINNLKLKRINYNEYKFSFTLLLAPFIGFLMFSSEKASEKSFWNHWNLCCFHSFFASAYFLDNTSNPSGNPNSLSIGFKSAISR
jgi:hypothetical protein